MNRRDVLDVCRPRNRNMKPKPIDDVHLAIKEYGVEKRIKTHRINEWDCRPEQKRIIDPNKSRNLRKALSNIEQMKIASTNYAICVAQTPAQKRRLHKLNLYLKDTAHHVIFSY